MGNAVCAAGFSEHRRALSNFPPPAAIILGMKKPSPMMQQYHDAKQACGDALLFFRMGDFYELFYEDAKVAAEKLGLALTSRDKSTDPVAMAGFPHHQLDGYLNKLIQMGYRVAVCDQVEDARQAKGLVKREITRVVSPGTLTDESLMDPRQASYLVGVFVARSRKSGSAKSKAPIARSHLAAAADVTPEPVESAETPAPADLLGNQPLGVAWAELATGQFAATVVEPTALPDLLARLAPREILVPENIELPAGWLPQQALINQRPEWTFQQERSLEGLCHQFQVRDLGGFGFNDSDTPGLRAAGAILEYLRETQKSGLGHLNRLQPFRRHEHLEIDEATWRSLEIASTSRYGRREGSLLGTIDRCVTSMGSRLLGQWVSAPSISLERIHRRLDAVDELVEQTASRTAIRDFLKRVYDVQRLLARVSTCRVTPRDVSNIGRTLDLLPQLAELLQKLNSQNLVELRTNLDPCPQLRDEIQRGLVEECPPHTKDGGFICSGYDSELDRLRELAEGGKNWIANYQAEITRTTDIPNLKVGFNQVFGYYLEVTQSHREKVPDYFIRKQTLKNAERYITPELKEYEEQVLSADDQARSLELKLFDSIRNLLQTYTQRLKANAERLAELDVLAALAELAVQHQYCRPQVERDAETEIVDGRHPVLDIVEPLGTFVPNSTTLSPGEGMIHLITGPNMAGKSTYIRQVALLQLMAQIGSFVPATAARIGIADKIFARVGASDELSRGQSTFMVEMSETARILNTASDKSLVILDEIGRGTSTYDGVSLAWAIVEFLHDQIGCRTLFATHYHELTTLEQSMEGLRNFNVTVKEWQDQIVFLHKIVPGAADRSYGIQVARLAGVPGWVNERAEQILLKLEGSGEPTQVQIEPGDNRETDRPGNVQLTLFEMVEHPLVDKIKRIDPNHVTPLDALQLLGQWKAELEKQEAGRQ